jgi:hypothetical protein
VDLRQIQLGLEQIPVGIQRVEPCSAARIGPRIPGCRRPSPACCYKWRIARRRPPTKCCQDVGNCATRAVLSTRVQRLKLKWG